MTAGISATVANSWLDTELDDRYVQLHTGDPGAAGTSNVSVGSTTRVQAITGAASAGSKSMSPAISGWTNGGTSETITHISLWTASSAGTFKASAALTASRAWVSTDTFTLDTLTAAITPIAA